MGLCLDELCDAQVTEHQMSRAIDIVEHQYKWARNYQNRLDELSLVYYMQNNTTNASKQARFSVRATKLAREILRLSESRSDDLKGFVHMIDTNDNP